jgi:hypothetical protein
MALKEKCMIKTVIGNYDLELKAKSGESILVKDIQIMGPGTNYITCKIEKTTVGYFRVGGALGSHLYLFAGAVSHGHNWRTSSSNVGDQNSFAGLTDAGGVEIASKMIGGLSANTIYYYVGTTSRTYSQNMKTLLQLLSELGIFTGFPVAEGETFLITGAKGTNAYQIVKYEIYDAGDIKNTDMNGSKATKYLYINYGNTGADIDAAGDFLYKSSVSPAEFPDFPFGATVPAKHKIRIHGILASDYAPRNNDGTNYIYTQFLKLVKERVTLFDEDRRGILMEGFGPISIGHIDHIGDGVSLIGNFSHLDYRMPFLFNPPLEFSEGEELNIYLTTVAGGEVPSLTVDKHEIGIIEEVEKVA